MKDKKVKDSLDKKVKIKLNHPLIIFLSLFILPGLVMGLFTTTRTIQLQSWVEVEATIDSTFYKHKTTKRPRSTGKVRSKRRSITRTQTRAKYTYRWEGKTYQSDQVAIWQASTKDEERNTALKKLLNEANTIKAFVNPDAPHEAVLVRCMHNGILFFYVSAFSCFFFFGAISGLVFKYPSFKFGVICLVLIVLLYAWFFGWGGVYLINCIEVFN